MTSNQALDMLFQTFQLSVQIALPLLLISMIVGIIMAIITAATSINEQTLTFVPKLLWILLILAVLGSTILARIQDFVYLVFNMIKTG